MQRTAKLFWADEGGATAVEYALVLSMIAVAIVAVLATLGLSLMEKLEQIVVAVDTAGG